MKIEKYKIDRKCNARMRDYDPSDKAGLKRKEVENELMPKNLARMAELQGALYAENRRGIVVVLQAMDAAGKDGLIKHVFTALNPQGTQVTPFKQPTEEELDHDYLWRVVQALPRRGNIGIFNRSHYEDVLVTRVHNLLAVQQIPQNLVDDHIWERRFEEIRNFEAYLHHNGFRVVKFFLHMSKDEQKKRLLSRIDREDKNWKFTKSDVSEREYWGEYQKAYEDLLSNTSTENAPWYVIPANHKWFSRYLVSEIFVRVLEDMDPKYPELPAEEKSHLAHWREVLEQDN